MGCGFLRRLQSCAHNEWVCRRGVLLIITRGHFLEGFIAQPILYYTLLYSTLLYYTILYHTISYYTIRYQTIPYYTTLFHTLPLYTLYSIVYTLHSVLYTIFYILYLYTFYYILYTIYHILYYIYTILSTILFTILYLCSRRRKTESWKVQVRGVHLFGHLCGGSHTV